MDVEKIFRMKGGHDETSYSRNSTLQKRASEMVKHITMETVEQVYLATCSTPQTLSIADLGCSSGPNSLSFITDLYRTVDDAYRKTLIDGPKSSPPKISVFLNDLPTNDFNSILKALPDLYNQIYHQEEEDSLVNPLKHEGYHRPSLFVAVSSGSFYGRLFHPNALHLVYSSYSLHWISKVPSGICDEHGKSMNKGCIYISENSPPAVTLAYVRQFQEDFSKFLHLRSQELSAGGRMILVFLGRDGPNHVDRGNSFLWQLLARSFSLLISKGQVEEQKLDSYDVHFYAASKEEIEEQVRKEGSFKLERLEMFVIEREEKEGGSYGKAVASTVRAIQEPTISHHFGPDILDPLFDIYAQLVDEEMCKQEIRPVTFLVLLSKL